MTRKYAFQLVFWFLVGFVLSFAWSAAKAGTFDKKSDNAAEWTRIIGFWKVSSYINPTTGKHSHCVITVDYDVRKFRAQAKTHTLSVFVKLFKPKMVDGKDAGAIGIGGDGWSLSKKEHSINMRMNFVKRQQSYDNTFTATPYSESILTSGDLLINDGFWKSIAMADTMTITVNDHELGHFSLKDSAEAFSLLHACAVTGDQSEGTF